MKVGDKVALKLSNTWVMVLEIDGSMVKCRTKDYKEVWFNEFELEEIKQAGV